MLITLLRRLIGLSGIRASGAAFSLAMTLAISHHLPMEESAKLLWIIAASAICSVVSRGGLDKGYMKLGASASELVSPSDTLSAALIAYGGKLLLASVGLASILFATGAIWLDGMEHPSDYLALAVGCSAVIAISICNFAGNVAIGAGSVAIGTAVIAFVAPFATFSLLVVSYVIEARPSFLLYTAIFAGGWFIAFGVLATYVVPRLASTKHNQRTKILIPGVLGFAAIGIANVIEQWAPTVVSGLVFDVEQAAYFAVASRIVSVVQIILISATGAYAYQYARASATEFPSVLRRSLLSLCSIGFPLVAGLIIFSDRIMTLFGQEYESGAGLLKILLAAQFFNVALGTCSVALMMRGAVRQVAVVFCVATIVQVGFSVAAASAGSPELLAVGGLVSVALHTCLCALVLYRKMMRP